jgi:hypothetical protein
MTVIACALAAVTVTGIKSEIQPLIAFPLSDQGLSFLLYQR